METKKEFDLLALGELLLRLSPPNNERIVRGETLQKQAGGAELNVVYLVFPFLGYVPELFLSFRQMTLELISKIECVSVASAMTI